MKYFLVIVLLVVGSLVSAQSYETSNHEVGLSFGTSNYLGDLSRNEQPWFFGEVEAKAFRPAFGIFYRNNFHKFLSFRAGMNIGSITGSDAWSAVGTSREGRNLSFKSNITDIDFMLEWNILPYKLGHYKHKFTPFIGLGVSAYFFNPKAQLDGRWVNLQALGTEGQGLIEYPNRSKYSKMGVGFPISFGMKLNLGKYWAIGAQMQYNYVFTDYLDDVSTVYPDLSFYDNNYITAISEEARALSYRGDYLDPNNVAERKRGNSDKNDAYFYLMLNVSVRIGNGRSSCPSFK